MAPYRSKSPFIYFLRRADGEGPVKIGCSQAPEERLATMMSWSPYPLAMLTKIAGDETLELRFHARLATSWSHGEWFSGTADALSVVDRVVGGDFDFAELPEKGKRCVRPRDYRRVKWTDGMKLRSRLQRLFSRSGIREPDDVKAASEAFDTLSPSEQVTARALIDAHLKNPTVRGQLERHAWCASTYSAWAAKNGAPPLVIAAAA